MSVLDITLTAPERTGNPAPAAKGMSLEQRLESTDFRALGEQMHQFIVDLYPICRSITGAGLRKTLNRIREQVPLEIREVPTGTSVFDWTVPKEWNIHDAWVKNDKGEKVIDFHKSNLHVLQYSIPVRGKMSLAELRPHLHTLPGRPDWTPYRTSYYQEDWGFCLAHRDVERLEDGQYEVCIDASLKDGSLSFGEYYLPGKRSDEVVISCHTCHPSLCNDNLSGVALVTQLARLLSGVSREYSYRFLFIPGTIGSITWLALNEHNTSRIRHGLVVACVGDSGRFHYKRSRRGNAEIDRVVVHALRHLGEDFEVRDFSPYGYDERQYCSPGFNLPFGSLTRTPHQCFAEYHTSADDLTFVQAEALAGSLALYLTVIQILENNWRCVNLNPKCEPQLGKRGLYRALGGTAQPGRLELAILWVLNLSDGHHSLLDIAECSGLEFGLVHQAAMSLEQFELLRRLGQTSVGDALRD